MRSETLVGMLRRGGDEGGDVCGVWSGTAECDSNSDSTIALTRVWCFQILLLKSSCLDDTYFGNFVMTCYKLSDLSKLLRHNESHDINKYSLRMQKARFLWVKRVQQSASTVLSLSLSAFLASRSHSSVPHS
jgi:hypothetical protein